MTQELDGRSHGSDHESSPSLVLIIAIGLLVLVGLERFTWYGARSVFLLFVMGEPDLGGLAIERESAASIYHWNQSVANWAPLWFGALAGIIRLRWALAIVAVLFPVACVWLALSSASSVFAAIILLSVAHGGLAVSIYVLAGRAIATSTYRIAFFCGVTAMLSLGAFLGPMVSAALAGSSYRTALAGTAVSAAATSVLAIALWIAMRQLEVVPSTLSVSKLVYAALFIGINAWYWFAFANQIGWTFEVESTWTIASTPYFTIAAAIAFCVGFALAGASRWRIAESIPVAVSLFLALLGLAMTPLVVGSSGSTQVMAIVTKALAGGVAEVLLIAALAAVSSMTTGRIAPLLVGAFVSAASIAGSVSIADEYSLAPWSLLVITTVLAIVLLGLVTWVLAAVSKASGKPEPS